MDNVTTAYHLTLNAPLTGPKRHTFDDVDRNYYKFNVTTTKD